MRVMVDIVLLAHLLAREGRRYVTRSYISRRLGVNQRTAGKILSRMASLGLARRYSLTTYEIILSAAQAPVGAPGGNPHYEPEDPEYGMDRAIPEEVEGEPA